MSGARWDFFYDDYGTWVPRRTPATDENTLRAVETLALSFSRDAESVRSALRIWRAGRAEHGVGYSVSTNSAALGLVSEDEVELQDMYGQFTNVTMPLEEFESMLEQLAQAITARDAATGSDTDTDTDG